MGRVLGDITSPNVESRYLNLAVAVEMLIDGTVHQDEKMLRGQIMGKIVASGKYRAYATAQVKTGGEFSTAADTFILENAASRDEMKFFQVGDVITDDAGNALGEIATFDPETGVGTLTGNSANNLAAGNGVILDASDVSIAKADVRILKSETLVEDGADKPADGYVEGFFNTAVVKGATSAALVAMGAKVLSSAEFRLV